MKDKNKLEMTIERAAHKFIMTIKEHTYDFVHIYLLNNKLNYDPKVVEELLKIVGMGIEDGFYTKIDMVFKQTIKEELDAFLGVENPIGRPRKQSQNE